MVKWFFSWKGLIVHRRCIFFMIQIQQIKMEPDHTKERLEKKILSVLRIRQEQLKEWKIAKCSIDARKKPLVKLVYSVWVEVVDEKSVMKRVENEKNITLVKKQNYQFPFFEDSQKETLTERPIIIGSGPAGLFCGLFLAEYGYRPLILEQGEDVDSRTHTVAVFWKEGICNPFSNVQFGEGGAGTFSDGKLNTLVNDNCGRNQKVLEILVNAGAPKEILYWNKPHIGTDVLQKVVKGIRKQIEAYGGEVRFLSQVTDLELENKEGSTKVSAVIVNEKERIPCQTVILAIGHSARDTFFMLERKSLSMSAKAFAVGVRIEHPQKQIDFAQYGMEERKMLPAADYKLTYKASNGRSVYSFCMCPGGYVVNASSEEGRLAVNGMSYSSRDGENANSAIIVSVTPEDFKEDSPLAGIAFQRQLEEAAYLAGKGKIPLQLFGDFVKNQKSEKFFHIKPNLKGDYCFANLKKVLPPAICDALEEGIVAFGKKISGFNRVDALLSGVESRTSSPVRIWRDSGMESNILGVYPCGEGAGYAGGITSAAMDGIKVAEAIAQKYAPFGRNI